MTAKTVQGECSHCGAVFDVPAEAIGMACECPHCRRQTEILLALPASPPDSSRKLMVWTIVGILVLVAALLAAIFAVHLARKLKEERRPRPATETLRVEVPFPMKPVLGKHL